MTSSFNSSMSPAAEPLASRRELVAAAVTVAAAAAGTAGSAQAQTPPMLRFSNPPGMSPRPPIATWWKSMGRTHSKNCGHTCPCDRRAECASAGALERQMVRQVQAPSSIAWLFGGPFSPKRSGAQPLFRVEPNALLVRGRVLTQALHTSVLRVKCRAPPVSRLVETIPVAERGRQKPAQSLSEHYIQVPCPVT